MLPTEVYMFTYAHDNATKLLENWENIFNLLAVTSSSVYLLHDPSLLDVSSYALTLLFPKVA
jgi:hypothetical protein